MRILVVSKFFPPLNSVASLRPYSWAKYWTREGHHVTVITSRNAHTSTALSLPDTDCVVKDVPLSPIGAALKRSYSWLSNREGGASPAHRLTQVVDSARSRSGAFGAGPRMPDVTGHSWAASALKAALDDQPWDVVISTAAPYVTHIVAERLKRRGRARFWIADYRDLWTDHHGSIGLPIVRAFERRYENRLMRHADAITTVSEPLVESLRQRHGPKVHLIENGADAEDFEALDPEPAFAPDGKVRIVYTGTVYDRQDPAPLFQALAEIKSGPDGADLATKLEVVFATRSTSRVDQEVRRFGIGGLVRNLGLLPRALALRMQRDADLLLFLPWNDPAADGILTGKVYEYLVSGAPILLVGSQGVEAAQRLILEAGRGIRMPGAGEIKTFLADYLRDPKRGRGKQSRPIAEHHNRRHLALKLLALAPAPEPSRGR